MMNRLFLVFSIVMSQLVWAQIDNIKNGEKLKYRIHYGFVNAGTAELSANQITYKGRPHYRVVGEGKSTGMVRAFFAVNDIYESYIDMQTGLPSYYVRNVSEGGYRRHYETSFDHDGQSLVLKDKLGVYGTRNFKTVKGIQDMLSAFYYLRSIENHKFAVGNYVKLNVWIDDESYPFVLRVAGIENKKTKFGTVECLKIIPTVQSGRVFKDKEGVTIWVTNDQNHIPVEMEAKLVVGSLKASLDGYQNNKYPIKFR